MSRDELFAAAMSLPSPERARLAQELLVSLHDGADADADAAWSREIEHRAGEVEDGTAVLEDWEFVRERLANRWRPR